VIPAIQRAAEAGGFWSLGVLGQPRQEVRSCLKIRKTKGANKACYTVLLRFPGRLQAGLQDRGTIVPWHRGSAP
jgi:hypothetical protein